MLSTMIAHHLKVYFQWRAKIIVLQIILDTSACPLLDFVVQTK